MSNWLRNILICSFFLLKEALPIILKGDRYKDQIASACLLKCHCDNLLRRFTAAASQLLLPESLLHLKILRVSTMWCWPQQYLPNYQGRARCDLKCYRHHQETKAFLCILHVDYILAIQLRQLACVTAISLTGTILSTAQQINLLAQNIVQLLAAIGDS